MGTQYVVKLGDCLSRIARRFGFSSYRSLYDAPANADFKAKHPDPNLINVGDVIQIPERKPQTVQAKTGGKQELTITHPLLIEAVGFVEDTEVKEGQRETPTQFVNLPRAAKWVDGTIVKSIDRLGQKPRLKVRFNKPGAHKFKLKIEPDAGNSAYSDAELGRNANFKHETAAKEYTTGADGTVIVEDIPVSCAGKDRFVFRATAEGTTQKSGMLGGQRLLYVQELRMTGAAAATTLAGSRGELAKAGIRVETLSAVAMDRMPNVSNSDADMTQFKQKVRSAYGKSDASKKEPYVIAIAYTDHLAVKELATVARVNVSVGPGKPDVTIPITDAGGGKMCLWNEIVPGESWFVSAKFVPQGGAAVALSAADCTALTSPGYPSQVLQSVKVKVSALTAGTGTLTLKVNWVNRMRAGISLGDGNVVCICTRAWWTTSSNADQNQTIVHEIGHQIGLVPDSSGKGLDRTPNQYSGKGHVGSHCHTGVADLPSYSSSSGKCAMFGASENLAYCADCAKAARKVDMSAGRPTF